MLRSHGSIKVDFWKTLLKALLRISFGWRVSIVVSSNIGIRLYLLTIITLGVECGSLHALITNAAKYMRFVSKSYTPFNCLNWITYGFRFRYSWFIIECGSNFSWKKTIPLHCFTCLPIISRTRTWITLCQELKWV